MTSGRYRFERFVLDTHDRQLTCDGAAVELNTRYLDALALLVSEPGKLVSKDRFLDEVWRGVPVTDEALTQCIRTLRRQLGDDAARPRFIETVVKHGYRFIAPVEMDDAVAAAAPVTVTAPVAAAPSPSRHQALVLGAAGTLGGGVAGLFGGMLYGFGAASDAPGTGAVSVLLVIMCLTIAVAVLGGAGVSFGLTVAGFTPKRQAFLSVLGGAIGGLLVGAVVKLLGLDAFNLLFGQSPGDITGAPEGALLGAAAGIGAWFANRQPAPSLRASAAFAGLAGGVAGLVIALLGRPMMAGSLVLLSQHFPASHLRLDGMWVLLGEHGFGTVSRIATGCLEGASFCAGVIGAMVLARRALSETT